MSRFWQRESHAWCMGKMQMNKEKTVDFISVGVQDVNAEKFGAERFFFFYSSFK
jgi:hypothetical protein